MGTLAVSLDPRRSRHIPPDIFPLKHRQHRRTDQGKVVSFTFGPVWARDSYALPVNYVMKTLGIFVQRAVSMRNRRAKIIQGLGPFLFRFSCKSFPIPF